MRDSSQTDYATALQNWGWLLGEGDARGIAMVFLISGLASILLGLVALGTRSYRRLSLAYATAPPSAPTSGENENGTPDNAL